MSAPDEPLTRADVEAVSKAIAETMRAEFNAELNRAMDAYDEKAMRSFDAALLIVRAEAWRAGHDTACRLGAICLLHPNPYAATNEGDQR